MSVERKLLVDADLPHCLRMATMLTAGYPPQLPLKAEAMTTNTDDVMSPVSYVMFLPLS